MDITVHLFVAGHWEPDDLLRVDDPAGTDRWTLPPRLALDFSCVAVGTFRAQDRPMWSQMLDGYFDVDWPRSVSASVVLLAHVADRWFAVTFGHGRHLLREERLVADFGLRVTANSVPADRVRSLSSVQLDGASRRTRQSVSIPSGLGRFSVDLQGEWIRSLGGETDGELSRGMTGSQSLEVKLRPASSDLKHLHLLLAHLLERYAATDYRDRFPFVDLVVPLHGADERVARLDAELVSLLGGPWIDVGIVTPDEQPGDGVTYAYRLRRRGRRWPYLDRLAVKGALGETADPLNLAVRVLDADGGLVRTRPLRMFLAAEVDLVGEGTFVLVEGRWFRVDPERKAWLERELAVIPELGHTRLDLPDWFSPHDEKTYNAAAATAREWILLDRRNFLGDDRRHDRIEVCDLLTPEMDLVCVKRLRDAASMSHLFAQGSVSATLYRNDHGYHAHVDGVFRARWPSRTIGNPTVVYAIGTDRLGPLARALPFFSRVNLCNHASTVRSTGCAVALSRIIVTDFATPPTTASIPEPRTERVGQLELFET